MSMQWKKDIPPSKYEQAKTSSNRYKMSSIPHLQRLLNKEAQVQQINFKKLKISTCHQLPLPHWGHLAVKINKFIIIIIIMTPSVIPFWNRLTKCNQIM